MKTLNTNGSGFAYYSMEALYLDWINNFISIESYAHHHGIEVVEAKKLIELAKIIYERGNVWH